MEELEDQVERAVKSLKTEESKSTIAQACKLLSHVESTINENHESLKQKINLHKACPSVYFDMFNMITRSERLFELRALLKRELHVKEKTEEKLASKIKPRIRLPKRKRSAL